ncbi:MAG: DUF6443 domain-containing protein, partial [Candidatus Zixiibacteriota bacterium]
MTFYCENSSNQICTNGNKSDTITIMGGYEWNQYNRYININNVDTSCLDHIRFGLSLYDEGTAVPYNRASFDDIRFHPLNSQMTTVVYNEKNGQTIASADINNYPVILEYDDFGRLIKSRNYKKEVIGTIEYYLAGDGISANNPNHSKSTSYSTPYDSTESVTFIDALGQIIQTRVYYDFDGDDAITIVQGKEYDAQGRVKKLYKPYFDENVNNSIYDYDNDSSFHAELYDYYDSTGPGPDCGDHPYVENFYEESSQGRLIETKFAYADSATRDNHSVTYEYNKYGYFFVNSIVNEDGVKNSSWIDALGRLRYKYADSSTSGLNLVTGHYQDFWGNDTLVIQPDNAKRIYKSYNNMGWLVSDSSPDYGTTRFVYNKQGQLRFLLNADDRETAPDTIFHYTKYDVFGRPIEQGVYDNGTTWGSNLMSFDCANSVSYPSDTAKCKITSQFVYEDLNFENTLGRITKSISHASTEDSASWEKYEYDELGNVIKKKQFNYAIDTSESYPKVMEAAYDNLGNLTKLVYPNEKFIEYFYKPSGLLDHILDGDTLLKVTWDYNPDGSFKQKVMGLSENAGPAQYVDYKYNSRGWLIGINDTVSGSISGSSDHYWLDLGYDDGINSAEYYNGNIASYTLQVSSGSGYHTMNNQFEYDNVDRLIKERHLHPTLQLYDKIYTYDANSNFDTVFIDLNSDESLDSTNIYTYISGTNRLYSTTKMGNDTIAYTGLGSFEEYEDRLLSYNFNNQLCRKVQTGVLAHDSAWASFWYNTSGQRIVKQFFDADLDLCGGGTLMSSGSLGYD